MEKDIHTTKPGWKSPILPGNGIPGGGLLDAIANWDAGILWYYPVIIIGNYLGCNDRRLLLEPGTQEHKTAD